jgi:amidohydrolase
MQEIRHEAQSIQSDLVDYRLLLHQEPELGLHLPLTQKKILDVLSDLNLEVTEGKTSTSVTAVLRGRSHERSVLLRADMDALPVQELTDLDCKSLFDGVMHACGHDLHVAMLLGAARILSKHRDYLEGDVVFMFQPGEEGFDGAGHMIKEGV